MNEYIAALVDEFYQLGVRHAVFSPGSRSTTMAMLFKEHEGFETYMNIDERSASFMALGIAKAHKEPTVLVCTSGSECPIICQLFWKLNIAGYRSLYYLLIDLIHYCM